VTDALLLLLRVAGAGLVLLALAHIPMSRELRWREEATRMSAQNESIFHVHTFFVCVMLAVMGARALFAPEIFIEPGTAAAWLSWTYALVWALRLYVQWFVFPQALWRGKRFETAMHVLFTVIWTALTVLFVVCGLVQGGHWP
jgi:hypothetical protein